MKKVFSPIDPDGNVSLEDTMGVDPAYTIFQNPSAVVMSKLDQQHFTIKETNPKDKVGASKPVQSTISRVFINEVRKVLGYISIPVLWKVGLGMEEGARKYRRHNYRVAGVRASIYYDATYRHIDKYEMGEDIDRDSNLSHVVKAICSLAVLVDAAFNEGMLNDDRPPISSYVWMPVEIFGVESCTVRTELSLARQCLDAWWEGADTLELIKAAAVLFRLADADALDDRGNKNVEWMLEIQNHMTDLMHLYPDPVAPYTEKQS